MSNRHGIHIGTRIKTHPATDWFMRGERYGTVTKVGRKILEARGDVSGLRMRFHIDSDLYEVV